MDAIRAKQVNELDRIILTDSISAMGDDDQLHTLPPGMEGTVLVVGRDGFLTEFVIWPVSGELDFLHTISVEASVNFDQCEPY